MRHGAAVRHLSELGCGVLDPALERQVARHAAACRACRDWMEARHLLAGALAPEGTVHPESSVLGTFCVDPTRLAEEDAARVRAHLEDCAACRNLVRSLGVALGAGRPVPVTPPASRGGTPVWRRPLAAGLAVLLLSVAAVGFAVFLSRGDGQVAGAPGAGPVVGGEPPPAARVADRTLDGTRVIRGRSLRVADVTITAGADITVDAEKRVVFGDGFRVASGARMRVNAPATAAPSDPPTSRDPGGSEP